MVGISTSSPSLFININTLLSNSSMSIYYHHRYYSRHPNYFCEQMIWVMIYCFSILQIEHMNQILNVWVVGAVLLIVLFQGSMAFSESITKSKYDGYREYQRRTSMCIPFFPKPRTITKKAV